MFYFNLENTGIFYFLFKFFHIIIYGFIYNKFSLLYLYLLSLSCCFFFTIIALKLYAIVFVVLWGEEGVTEMGNERDKLQFISYVCVLKCIYVYGIRII